jgi:L-threonylcarbamoyladenylate synthase
MKTLKLHGDLATDIDTAARLLRQGELVAVPTETVYGLAANAADPEVVKGIFAAKGRPANHPLIVHLPSADQLTHWATDIPNSARQLAEAFWPGPLTLLLHKHPDVSPVITGGLDTIGLRVPAHPVLLRLLQSSGLGVAAPSANPYKKLSPTTASQVHDTLQGRIAAVLDGGPCEVGIESTIVDLTGPHIQVLRPGPISAHQIAQVLQQPVGTPEQHQMVVPGNVEEHYQPGKPLQLFNTQQLQQALHKRPDGIACVVHSVELGDSMRPDDVRLSADPKVYAQALYQTLYQLDQGTAQVIWLELPPDTEAWQAVNDRLLRAGKVVGG